MNGGNPFKPGDRVKLLWDWVKESQWTRERFGHLVNVPGTVRWADEDGCTVVFDGETKGRGILYIDLRLVSAVEMIAELAPKVERRHGPPH